MQGQVSCFLNPTSQRVVSFRGHQSPICEILPDPEGVVTISADAIRYHSRGGVARAAFRSVSKRVPRIRGELGSQTCF